VTRAARFREEAAALRARAERTSEPLVRAAYLELANRWQLLAGHFDGEAANAGDGTPLPLAKVESMFAS